MFLGEFQHSLDGKGRIVLPRKFRDGLAAGCVITKGQDRCLYIFAQDKWDEEVTQVMRLPRTNRRARDFSRTFFAGAADQAPDKQGRIAIPAGLRDYAGLSGDVVVVGVADRVEVWDPEQWRAVSEEADASYSEIEETLHEEEGI